MFEKLKNLAGRYEEINHQLNQFDYDSNPGQYQKLAKELSQLNTAKGIYDTIVKIEKELGDNKILLETEQDPVMREMIQDELNSLTQKKQEIYQEAQVLLLPRDPNDDQSAIIEIRAGTGGDEAALFVADLARMYRKFAESQGFTVNFIDSSDTGLGGFKEFIFQVEGSGVYKMFKHEAGTHRVQRVPETETQGRVHTSAITVAVLPEAEEVKEIEINPADLKIDTYRSQGAGGQHVNTTDSAVRITHLPTGIVVACQEERSQIKNRSKAMQYLKIKIYEQAVSAQQAGEDSMRKSMVGSGDRSERIRTYNYPQGRISDHRIKLTIYRLEEIMQSGDISEIVNQLLLKEQFLKLDQLKLN